MRDNYRIDDKLGEGAFGEVRKCIFKEDMKDKRSSIKDYRAVKILSKAYMEEKERNSFVNEVSCMMQIEHPSIMTMHHFYEDPKRFLLVTELSNGGELFDYTQSRKEPMAPNQAALVIKQLLSAVSYMHNEVHMVHRDLKPENILLEHKDNLSQIRLIDFGTAKRFKTQNGEPAKLYDKVGTVAYMAPEVLGSSKEMEESYSEKCDVWSVGILAYLLVFKDYPIKGKNGDEHDLRKKVKNFNIDKEVDSNEYDAMFGNRNAKWKRMSEDSPSVTDFIV